MAPGCKGNRLEAISQAGPSCSSTTTPSSFKVVAAHHKNSSKGKPGFEVVITNSTLDSLLKDYLRYRWVGGLGGDGAAQPPHLA